MVSTLDSRKDYSLLDLGSTNNFVVYLFDKNSNIRIYNHQIRPALALDVDHICITIKR